MTKQEAAIVAAYTGKFLGDFSTLHEYIEKLLQRPVFTHELASKSIANEIKEKAKNDFINLIVE